MIKRKKMENLFNPIEIKYSFSLKILLKKFKENIWKYKRKEIFEEMRKKNGIYLILLK